MTLKEIRTQLVKLSGRYDLVVDTVDYVDNGADFFIHEASRFLDRKSPEVNREDSAFVSVAQGEYSIFLEGIRVIKEVWVYGSEVRYKLREYSRDRLKELFPKILSNDSEGIPAWYAPVFTVAREGSTTDPLKFLTGIKTDVADINGIIFPPVNGVYIFEVTGKYYSPQATEDAETNPNYWARNHGMLLVWAALYLLEVSYRNTEGSNDWLRAIEREISGIDMDFVEQDSVNLRQLGGRRSD